MVTSFYLQNTFSKIFYASINNKDKGGAAVLDAEVGDVQTSCCLLPILKLSGSDAAAL